ncbi:MAG: class I SAM-dependent methyltransferase, partial [Xanthobacteraceae bacterium]
LFPWHRIGNESVGADIGCGSGRWAHLVAPRVGRLLACDASADALAVARHNLEGHRNVDCHLAAIDRLPIADASLDFAYCLGVLHHVPDPQRALSAIARKLKPGAPLLVYIYYAFDNRPPWYRLLWRATNGARIAVARLPHRLQLWLTTLIALSVYWPLARTASVLERFGILPPGWPLAWYRQRSLYVMRTDAFDRFCTRLEHRFTRAQIDDMLRRAGMAEITFSTHEPFWCAVGVRSGT